MNRYITITYLLLPCTQKSSINCQQGAVFLIKPFVVIENTGYIE